MRQRDWFCSMLRVMFYGVLRGRCEYAHAMTASVRCRIHAMTASIRCRSYAVTTSFRYRSYAVTASIWCRSYAVIAYVNSMSIVCGDCVSSMRIVRVDCVNSLRNLQFSTCIMSVPFIYYVSQSEKQIYNVHVYRQHVTRQSVMQRTLMQKMTCTLCADPISSILLEFRSFTSSNIIYVIIWCTLIPCTPTVAATNCWWHCVCPWLWIIRSSCINA